MSGAGKSRAGKSRAGKSGAGKSGAGESGAGESGAGESGASESGAGDEHKTASVYEVGFGKPPEHSRFKPGQSGNPKGRPKGSKNLGQAVERALAEKVGVTVDGRRKTMCKTDVIARQVVDRAAKGDLAAVTAVARLAEKAPAGEGGRTPSSSQPTGFVDTSPSEIPQERFEEIVMAFVQGLSGGGKE